MDIKKLQKITEVLDKLVKISKGELIDVGFTEGPESVQPNNKYYPTFTINASDFSTLKDSKINDIIEGEYIAKVVSMSRGKTDDDIKITLDLQKIGIGDEISKGGSGSGNFGHGGRPGEVGGSGEGGGSGASKIDNERKNTSSYSANKDKKITLYSDGGKKISTKIGNLADKLKDAFDQDDDYDSGKWKEIKSNLIRQYPNKTSSIIRLTSDFKKLYSLRLKEDDTAFYNKYADTYDLVGKITGSKKTYR